eukprot:TRINITY_DN42914_c0_g1_i1.p1 TRINITY_DN42914_c0_g1~~TRINITY_DN42914_c0_g1_i1.p1  ORF type:complete len:416 (-),score=91.85 TRINITY_DN42914_c0_g1_i1:56-1303(-)
MQLPLCCLFRPAAALSLLSLVLRAAESVDLQRGLRPSADNEAEMIGFEELLSMVTSSTSRPSSSVQIEGMEQALLDIASGKDSRGVPVQIQEMNDTIQQQLKEDLDAQFLKMRLSLHDTYNAIQHCESNCSARDAVGVSPDTFQLPQLEARHRACRREEQMALERSVAERRNANTSAELRDHICSAWRSNESAANLPPKQQCNFDSSVYKDQETSVVDYLRDMRDFWIELAKRTKYARLQCEDYTRRALVFDESAARLEGNHSSLRETCHSYQVELDEASCSYVAAWDPVCIPCLQCYSSAESRFKEELAGARELTAALQDQMESALRIECYLNAFLTGYTNDNIDECTRKNYASHERVLALKFPDELEKLSVLSHRCGADAADSAGTAEYAAKYYAGLGGSVDSCRAGCCSGTR